MSQYSKTYSIVSSCSNGVCKNTSNHYHTMLISDFNTWLNNNIPQNAIITKVVYESKSSLDYSVGSSITYANITRGLYYGNGENNGIALDSKVITVYGDVVSTTLSKEIDINTYFSTSYPFSMSTQSPRLVLCFTTPNVFATNISCEYARIVVHYDTRANFYLTSTNGVYDDEYYGLSSKGNVIGSSFTIENESTVTLYAKSKDGRKIIGLEQYEGSTLISSLSSKDISPFLSEDGSVLNLQITCSKPMVGKTYQVVIIFDKKVYVTYDSSFNHLKWHYEGLTESGVIYSTYFHHTIERTSNATDNCWTPLFPITSGYYWLKFKTNVDSSSANVGYRYRIYNSSKQLVEQTDFKVTPLNQASFVSAYNGYVSFNITNYLTGSKVTYSDFVLYPYDTLNNAYDYMETSLTQNQRVNSGKWDMPTPVRENYYFTGWNTKIDGSGVKYTSNSPYPTEDLVLYSQWSKNPVSNVYVGNAPMDVYVGTTPVDVYVGTTLI